MHASGTEASPDEFVISSCSDASTAGYSSGIYVAVISDVHIAEALGVLLGMWHICCLRDTIRLQMMQMSEPGCTGPFSIVLITDRDCLETVLPRCEQFFALRTMLQRAYVLETEDSISVIWERRESDIIKACDAGANVALWTRCVLPLSLRLHPLLMDILKKNKEWERKLLAMETEWLTRNAM